MVEITKDRKGKTWIVTKTDSEGFHRQINMTKDELDELTSRWLKLRAV
jgi:hypothetical protein